VFEICVIFLSPRGGPLSNNQFVACLVNLAEGAQQIYVNFTEIGVGPIKLYLRDLWAHKSLGQFNGFYLSSPVNGNGTQMIKGSFTPI
jgi:hypothetical protein